MNQTTPNTVDALPDPEKLRGAAHNLDFPFMAPSIKEQHEAAALLRLCADHLEASARAMAAVPAAPVQKMAPVQGWPQGIPWSLHLEAYAVYCKKWGAQPALIDLEGRNCRGGFGTGELDMFIPGWRERVSEITALRAANAKLRADISGMVQADADAALAHMQQAGGVPAGLEAMRDALESIRSHCKAQPSALAAAIVATCDSALDAAPSPSAVLPPDSVKMPTTADEAALMTLLGTAWLKEHAPDRLKPEAVQRPDAKFVNTLIGLLHMVGETRVDSSRRTDAVDRVLSHIFSTAGPSAVRPTVEQAIVQLVEALVQSKGWLHAYADSVVRDAIDRKEAQPPSVVDKSMLKRLVTQVFGEEFQITRAVQPLSEAQIEVLRFLDGVGDLRGFGFGDKPPSERGNYWWRKDLRAAFPDVDFGIVTPKEPT